jgi:hypothetical protein
MSSQPQDAPTGDQHLERAWDGDAEALAHLSDAEVVARERRMAGLLAIALDPGAAATARIRVGRALDAIRPSVRRKTVAAIGRRIGPARWPWLAAAALIVLTVAIWGVLRRPPGELADGSIVVADGSARWSEQSVADGIVVSLREGRIAVRAAAQPAGRLLRVRTAQAEAAVVGTVFSVAATERGTLVEVEAGGVRVTGRRVADRVYRAGEHVLVPARGGWRSEITPAGTLRGDPIAWWLGTPATQAGIPALAAAVGDDGDWIGVRARLRGGYRIAPGDSIRLRLHAVRPLVATIQAERSGVPGFAATQVSLTADWQDVEVPWERLRSTSGSQQPVQPGDVADVLLVFAVGATPGDLAVGSLELADPGP